MVNPSEPEFEQARNELTSTLGLFLSKNPEYKTALEIVQVPERVLQFRVVWEDDEGKPHVNTGYRVQYNSALGPYKGGLRLHPSVNLSILKFLGFEQTFKNALTSLSMGGGKGGSDFNPKGLSDNSIRRFCESFMRELSRHVGAETDVPAGDIGTGAREIGFLFGAYRRLRNEWVGVLTGKGASWGGSFVRPEATGYGLVYYVEHMLAKSTPNLSFTSPSTLVALSGSGNVAQFAAQKLITLGSTVLSLSDSRGTLLAPRSTGYTAESISAIAQLKLRGGSLAQIVDSFNAASASGGGGGGGGDGWVYVEGKRPWTLLEKVDVALPCATQNEVSGEEAEALLSAGVRIVAEGSNMGCTQEAIDVFEASRSKGGSQSVWYAPGKASNCGGVAVSGLEMAQNSQRIQWSPEEVDAKLKKIMTDCYNTCLEYGSKWTDNSTSASDALPSLVVGANVAGFVKVADAMREQGDWW